MNNTTIFLSEQDSHRLSEFFPFYKNAGQFVVKNTEANYLILPISPTGLLGLKKVWMPYYNYHPAPCGVAFLECFTKADFPDYFISKLDFVAKATLKKSNLKFNIAILTNVNNVHPNVFWIDRDDYQESLNFACICPFTHSTLHAVVYFLQQRKASLAVHNN